MNDYLWDKSGETDAEVERLENLLANLRADRRPLELPPEIFVAHSRRRTLWLPYAAAAALALMALAALWSFLAYQRSSGRDSQTLATAPQKREPEKTGAATTTATATPDRTPEEALAPEKDEEHAPQKKIDGQMAHDRDDEQKPRVAPRRKMQQLAARQQRAPMRRERFNTEDSRGAEQPDSTVADLQREREFAKEQLMLALRLTSEKLNVVQRKTQQTNATGGKPSPEEQNKLR